MKNPKLKKTLQEYENRDLIMVNYTCYITVLDAVWVQRISHSNSNCTKLLSSSELNIDVDNLWKFGIEYIKNLTVKTTNGFWIDMFQRWSKVYIAKCETVSDVYCDHIMV